VVGHLTNRCGVDASSTKGVDTPPYPPTWPELVRRGEPRRTLSFTGSEVAGVVFFCFITPDK